MSIDIDKIRAQFPALQKEAIYFDNPGGTQVAQASIDRSLEYLIHYNANHGGVFETSRNSDALLEDAHQAVADFFNASRAEEIVFGPNMTSLTFQISRALARDWKPGDTIVVTRLDHDANITPWVMAAEEHGCQVLRVDFNPADGTLDMDAMQRAMESKPRMVAVGYASNALGTINPLAKIIPLAHAAGALVYVDAVQYAPHGPIDVQALDCDFLAASSYKFFGPHVGMLYGKYELLEELTAYKVRPAPVDPPGKFETGTQNHEGIAGVLGALEYLAWVGDVFGKGYAEKYAGTGGSELPQASDGIPSALPLGGRKLQLKQAMAAIRAYEYELSRLLLDVLEETPGVTVYGPTDRRLLEQRVPTVSFTLKGWHPRDVAQALDEEGIYVWDGNYYALAVTERLGLEDSGGMVRVGPVHYNTVAEVERFGDVLRSIG